MNFKAFTGRSVLERYYFTARLIYHRKLRLRFDHIPLIVVYQMGKVGSSSIQRSLWATSVQMPIVKAHALSEAGIHEWENRYYGKNRSILTSSKLPHSTHLFHSYYLRQRLLSTVHKNDLKIITLVRDPIARNISEFFHSIDTVWHQPYLPDFYGQYAAGMLSTKVLLQRYLQVYHEDSWEFQVPLRWFDHEFKPIIGIDVFASKFPKDKGYMCYSIDGIDVLLLKLESLQQCATEAFQEFLGLKNFCLTSDNLANDKGYSTAYVDFIKNAKFPECYLNTVYSSKAVRHFYTDKEIDAFWRKWQKT